MFSISGRLSTKKYSAVILLLYLYREDHVTFCDTRHIKKENDEFAATRHNVAFYYVNFLFFSFRVLRCIQEVHFHFLCDRYQHLN